MAMITKLLASGLVVLGCAGSAMADRGDWRRGSDRWSDRGSDRGRHYDRGDRYRDHGSSGRWSFGFGYSNDAYRGDSSFFSLGYRSGGFGGAYRYSYSSGPTYVQRRVYVDRPVYIAPPTVCVPQREYVDAPIYVAPPIIYQTAPSAAYPSGSYYDSCGGGTYYRSGSYYYGR
jgi:hypothetical protein